jgi:hypothetical protein
MAERPDAAAVDVGDRADLADREVAVGEPDADDRARAR